MIWTKESKGIFTMKSAYFVAQTCHGLGREEPVGSTVNEETKILWKAWWCAKASGKVKICVWCVCMNALPLKVNLKNRRVLREDICGFCNKKAETFENALLQCPQSTAIWFGSPLRIHTFSRVEEGFNGWLINMEKTITKDSFELILVLVWSVWKVHNKFLWNGVNASPWMSNFKLKHGYQNLRNGMRFNRTKQLFMFRSENTQILVG